VPRVVPSQIVRVIDRHCPWAKGPGKVQQLNANNIGTVAAIVGLVDRLPAHLLTLNEEEYANFITHVEVLRIRPQFWATQPGTYRSGETVREIRNLLDKCPDDWPPPSVHSLSFITKADDLRDNLRIDIDHAERALDNSEWKAATVLAGSVVEALLLWKLSVFPTPEVLLAGNAAAKALGLKGVNPDLRRWHLPELIEVTASYPTGKPVIGSDTATQLRLVRDFRNLIHPGRAERLAKKCDRNTALIAVGGIVAVVNELS
jgi:hypothetical protein